jgi:hypothetical protein
MSNRAGLLYKIKNPVTGRKELHTPRVIDSMLLPWFGVKVWAQGLDN